MKYFNILLILFYIPSSVFGFGIINNKYRNGNLKMSNDGTINEVLKYKDVLSANTYNTLISRIKTHDIKKIYVTNKLDAVIAKDASEHDIITDYSITKINPFVVTSIVDESNKNNVETYFLEQPQISGFEVIAQNVFGLLEGYVFPFLFLSFIVSLFRFANNPMGPGGNMPGMPGFQNRKAVDADKINMIKANVSLNSFAGSREIFEECTEVVSYLKNDSMYKLAGAEIPRGILLEGPPGTGKTLLAKAIASEAEANFISVAASEFVEMYVGLGASKIRALFQRARENKPCILFIDEIDAVGRQRGAGINMANDEREQTLNQLLAEMDGFADNEGILIMAATNRKDVLDSALLRPGRFDRIILVPLPDRESRKEIFKAYSKNKKLSPEINFELISELTNGFSGAQIKNLLNEAAIFTSRRGEIVITELDLLNAADKLIVGLSKKVDNRSDESKRRIAIHETGHALLVALFEEYFELKKVTMQSTYNGAGGYTLFNENQNITDSGLYTKDLLKKRLLIGMGGKAAENIFYGEEFVSVGAVQDLKQTNSLAQQMIGNYGMGDQLEAFYNENLDSDRTPFLGRSLGASGKYSEKTKEILDKESLELVNTAYNDAKTILMKHKDKMDMIVDELMKSYTLYGKDIKKIME
uniref:AAA+ ATPase domain-containing protein n=1 Tax=viral metagenome TaxID=1070528 RepID=A0A6C0HBE5_9ZZZZ